MYTMILERIINNRKLPAFLKLKAFVRKSRRVRPASSAIGHRPELALSRHWQVPARYQGILKVRKPTSNGPIIGDGRCIVRIVNRREKRPQQVCRLIAVFSQVIQLHKAGTAGHKLHTPAEPPVTSLSIFTEDRTIRTTISRQGGRQQVSIALSREDRVDRKS